MKEVSETEILQKNFSDFGKTKSSPKEISKLFVLDFKIERLDFAGNLPEEYLPKIKALEQKIERQIQRFELNNEIGKRDFFIAPVFSQLFDWIDFELATEKYFNVGDGLRGNIDYLIKGNNEILIVEAKNDDFDGGANQIIAELVAVGRTEQGSVINLYELFICYKIWNLSLQRIERFLGIFS